MKRLFVLVVLLMLSCSLAFATIVIEAEGTGKTLEEAKENARVALAEKVFPGTVVVETKTSINDSSEGDYYSSFSQKSSYSVIGEFPGFDYNIVSSTKNNYVVSTQIVGDVMTLNFYLNRVEDQKKNVEEFYHRYISLDSNTSATQRRQALALVIEYYYYYNMYSNILLCLGGSPIDVDIPTTIAVLQVDYQSLLDEESNELLTKSSITSISQEIKEELIKNSEAQEAYRKAQEETKLQIELQRKLMLDSKIDEIINRTSSLRIDEVGTSLDLNSFNNYIEVIKSADSSLAEASREYDRLVEEQNSIIEVAFEEEATAIRNRIYPLAHQDRNGNPTDEAEELREKEVEELRLQKNKEKEEALATIDSKLCSEIQKRYDYLVEAIVKFQGEVFTISSKSGDAKLSYQWDGSDYSWLVSVVLNNQYLGEFDNLKLLYSDVSGTKIPKDKDAKLELLSSTDYKNTVETYNRLLLAEQYSFDVKFKSALSLDGQLTASLESLVIEFPDGVDVEIGTKDSTEITSLLELEKADYLKYSWLKKSSVVKTTKKEKGGFSSGFLSNLRIGLSFDGQIAYALGLQEGQPLQATDLIVESRLFFFDFFCSIAFNMEFWTAKVEKFELPIMQVGVFGGIGYKFNDFILCSVRAMHSKELGLIVNPNFAFETPSFENGIWLGWSFGAYVNCRTWKWLIPIGIEVGWRAF